MYFQVKNTLKNNYYHTFKYSLKAKDIYKKKKKEKLNFHYKKKKEEEEEEEDSMIFLDLVA